MKYTHNGVVKAARFTLAAGREMTAVFLREEPVSPEEKARRLAICKSCPNHDAGICALCGCNLRLKAGWRFQHCPDNPSLW